jgi:hypothetical protein
MDPVRPAFKSIAPARLALRTITNVSGKLGVPWNEERTGNQGEVVDLGRNNSSLNSSTDGGPNVDLSGNVHLRTSRDRRTGQRLVENIPGSIDVEEREVFQVFPLEIEETPGYS